MQGKETISIVAGETIYIVAGETITIVAGETISIIAGETISGLGHMLPPLRHLLVTAQACSNIPGHCSHYNFNPAHTSYLSEAPQAVPV